MSELTYKVKREGDDVFYYIYRAEDLVTKKMTIPLDVGFWGILLSSNEGLIKRLLIKANKQAAMAIKSMIKYEKH